MQEEQRQQRPPQCHAGQPLSDAELRLGPRADRPGYQRSGKLPSKLALTAGGDSGIGRAMAVAYARRRTKVAFTHLLSHPLAESTLRVHGMALSLVRAPLMPVTFPANKVSEFGRGSPLQRTDPPEQIAPGYCFLTSYHGSYLLGQRLHASGSTLVNG